MVPENAQRQAHQDRSQGGQPFPLRDISDGGSGCAADALSGNPWPDQAVAFFDNTCEAGMMCGTVENQVPEWRATVAFCQNGEKNGFLTQVLGFLGVFCETTRWGTQRIVAISMRFRYYGISSVQESFSEVYMGNPG